MSDISDFVKRMTSCSKLELDGKIPVEPPFSYCMVYIDNFTSLEPFDPSKVTKDHVVVYFKIMKLRCLNIKNYNNIHKVNHRQKLHLDINLLQDKDFSVLHQLTNYGHIFISMNNMITISIIL